MKPITQDIFANDPEGRVGNCLQAAVASILELELNDVPHFCGSNSDNWYRDMSNWFTENNYNFYDVNTMVWMRGYAIACGMSERGVKHAVVYKDGELVHDPHPSNGGIEKPEWYYIISKK